MIVESKQITITGSMMDIDITITVPIYQVSVCSVFDGKMSKYLKRYSDYHLAVVRYSTPDGMDSLVIGITEEAYEEYKEEIDKEAYKEFKAAR